MLYITEINRKYAVEQNNFLNAHAAQIEIERKFETAETVEEIDRLADELIAADDAETAAAQALIDWMIDNVKTMIPAMWKSNEAMIAKALKLRRRADVKHNLVTIALKFQV